MSRGLANKRHKESLVESSNSLGFVDVHESMGYSSILWYEIHRFFAIMT